MSCHIPKNTHSRRATYWTCDLLNHDFGNTRAMSKTAVREEQRKVGKPVALGRLMSSDLRESRPP